MIKKIITILTCLAIGVALFIPRPSRADDELTVLRIAATLALEVGGHKTESLNMVAGVLQVRYIDQNRRGGGATTWADILYGVHNQFEHSRGFASKTKEELKTYIKNKSGAAWANVIAAAKRVYNHTADTSILNKRYQGKDYTINSFMMNYKGVGAETKKGKDGKWLQTKTIYTDAMRVNYFYADLGKLIKFKNYRHFDDNAPEQSHKYDNHVVDQYITGKYARGNGSSIDVGEVPESTAVDYGGGSSSSATPQKKPKGYANKDQCSESEMAKIYMQSDGEDSSACWYCKVVVILANAYLQAASKAIPSAVGLGKVILKFGFLIWLAYFILQQVSSFAPIKISKVIQDILVMGFKVSLAYFIMDSAEVFIVNYFIDPIGTFGTDYGSALFDKLHNTSG